MGRYREPWAYDQRKRRKHKRAVLGRKRKLQRLIEIQAREMKYENISRGFGDSGAWRK